jgi:hypothetical protein
VAPIAARDDHRVVVPGESVVVPVEYRLAHSRAAFGSLIRCRTVAIGRTLEARALVPEHSR